jgi:ferredoxin
LTEIKKHINLNIDGQNIEVSTGTNVFEAAKAAGIEIPNMCYLKGYTNHPSCMICVVKDKKTGKIFPSCGIPASEGMEIITRDEDIVRARKDTLELMLSDHVGECEARCRVACPAFMDIPQMNRLIAEGKPIDALKVVKEEIALPLVLGYVCQAPCENACRRNSVDDTVAICQLKKYVALQDARSGQAYMPEKKKSKGIKVAIIGAGPSGLTAAFHLTKDGFDCEVIDERAKAGGSLLDPDQPLELPADVLEMEIDILQQFGIKFKLNTRVDRKAFDSLKKEYQFVIIASGKFDPDKSEDFGLSPNSLRKGLQTSDGLYATEREGVFLCGSVIKPIRMAVQAVAEGKAVAHFINSKFESGEGKLPPRIFNSKFSKLKSEEIDEYLKESIPDGKLDPADKLAGFVTEDAVIEAERCLRCDCRKPVSCKLRIYSEEYGASQSTYQKSDRELVTKKFTHPLIVYESEKCIRCGLCVDIGMVDNEKIGFTHVGRGFDVKIGIPFGRALADSLDESAEKCAFYCPTAAISIKDYEERKLDHDQ